MKSESNSNSNRSSFTNSNPDYDRYKPTGRMTMPDGSMTDAPGNSNHEALSETTSKKAGKGIIREGFMVRYGRRKYGRSFIHKRYFVLEPTLLAYYKRKPSDNEIPIKSLNLDASCRVEDKGMEHHHGHAVYVLSIHNKKDKSNHITMASFSLNEANSWKEAIERVIEQYPHFQAINGNNHLTQNEISRNAYHQRTSSYDGDAKYTSLLNSNLMIQEKDKVLPIDQAKTGDTNTEAELDAFYPTIPEMAPMKHWRLVRCQNGLRIFEDFSDDTDGAPRAMKAVGVVDAKCEDIFSLIMGMDETRNEWDSTFHSGFMVEEVNGHTAVLYHRLQLDWCSWLVWPRDLCYQRYWRRIENGTYVVLFRSREHQNCPPQPGCVRAHIESGGFKISPLKPRHGIGTPRARVEHQIQIDFEGWGIRYLQFYQHHCVMQMLNSVAGLREWFAQSEDAHVVPLFNRVITMDSQLSNVKREKKKAPMQTVNQIGDSEVQVEEDESEDEDDSAPINNPEPYREPVKKDNPVTPLVASPADGKMLDPIDLSAFPSVVDRGDHDKGRNSWSVPNSNLFRVRSRQFSYDRSKVPAGEPLMQLVAVDWFKHSERMDHLAQRKGCAAQIASEKGLFTLLFNLQVPGSTHYSMVLYFVSRSIPPHSLLQRFIDGDDGFRNSRLKLIPSVPKGSWIVRQSVGTTPCILGKAVDCNYFRGQKYLEVDVDIGSSTVANGVLGLVFGVIASLVVDMAFLIQGNSFDELPEKIIGTVRISRLELSKAISPYPEKEKLP